VSESINSLLDHILGNLQDPRLLSQLQSKHGDNLEDKSLTVCSGFDLVNIIYTHFVYPDAETAKVAFVVSYIPSIYPQTFFLLFSLTEHSGWVN
jgi:hypothetical protein